MATGAAGGAEAVDDSEGVVEATAAPKYVAPEVIAGTHMLRSGD